jgi:hypothetical protein
MHEAVTGRQVVDGHVSRFEGARGVVKRAKEGLDALAASAIEGEERNGSSPNEPNQGLDNQRHVLGPVDNVRRDHLAPHPKQLSVEKNLKANKWLTKSQEAPFSALPSNERSVSPQTRALTSMDPPLHSITAEFALMLGAVSLCNTSGMSVATTLAPREAATRDTNPVPQPNSMTDFPVRKQVSFFWLQSKKRANPMAAVQSALPVPEVGAPGSLRAEARWCISRESVESMSS